MTSGPSMNRMMAAMLARGLGIATRDKQAGRNAMEKKIKSGVTGIAKVKREKRKRKAREKMLYVQRRKSPRRARKAAA